MPVTSATTRRDPIREHPLRDPGQSLRGQIFDRLDTGAAWLGTAVFAVTIAALEWLRWWMASPYIPLLVSAMAIGVCCLSAWQWRKGIREIEQLKLGLRGERAVGQFLQAALMPMGYTIVHDVCIDDFNIDHVAIGPAGVFAVEVKTRTKPLRGDARVQYDGQTVTVDGFVPDRNPVVQARAGAKRIEEILARYTGRSVAVRAAVLFPGWFINPPPANVETCVLNEKAFVKFLDREPKRLTDQEARVLAEGLSRYVRDKLETA